MNNVNKPPFQEKRFLLGLLAVLNEKYGQERRHIFSHHFLSSDIPVAQRVGCFDSSGKQNIPNLLAWLEEAAIRGFMVEAGSNRFVITEKGYEQARYYQDPVKGFYRRHYKLIVTSVIMLLGVVATVLGIIF